ncbi:MAG: carboxypeptidase-like regulatory domain-containing protein [Saprospiraceae bacterium]|nr:MAG: carboxypeptidase-like regulatory domain-containing protein [Saprospiraceae bacterium]
MHLPKITKHLLTSFLFCCIATAGFSQKMTIVKGVVIDAETKETLPLVNIAFAGTAIGTTTDLDGSYVLESKWASDSIRISYVGYETLTLPVQKGIRQEMNVAMSPFSVIMKTVEVKAHRGNYKRKGNPAVALMKKVIAHKGENRIESQQFYQYDKYDKVQFDLNNFDPESLKKRRAMKKFQFLLDYVDTSEINGKPFLPFFIQETSAKVYYRKNPEVKKEYRDAVKVTGFKDYVDLEDFTTMMDVLYQNIDIYQDNIRILDLTFMSPISTIANTFYRYYLTDTSAVVNGVPCTKVSFMPVNNQNIAFTGDLYILKDSSYAVAKADLGITRQINLNFVQDLKLLQEFTRQDSTWVLSKDKLMIDFGLFKKGTGIYGTRTVSYKNFSFKKAQDDSVYAGTENIVAAVDAYQKTDTYWEQARHDTLSAKEKGIYQMIDTLQKVPAFRTAMDVMSLLFTGYKAIGSVDIGPVGSFYSFNDVEGFRAKIGGETNLKFNPKISIAGLLAYGFKDQEFKYAGSLLYSFREDFKTNPKHFLRLFYQHEVNLVGQTLQFTSADNFFVSFQRGSTDRMTIVDRYQAEYFLELDNNLSWDLKYINTAQHPAGSFHFDYFDPQTQELTSLAEVRTSELSLRFRFAPNEQFLQGRTYRMPIFNRYPIFTFNFAAGFNDWLGGKYEYQKASVNIFKRFYLSFLGNLRFEAEAGKIWGSGVPYFLLHLPRANQSFAYRTGAYNMMNYMEFASDEYVSLSLEHFFNGFIFNKIPLLRKAKLREVITFKAIYGSLSDQNNPAKNPEAIQFLKNSDGQPLTTTLEDKPYMEASVGVANIMKFFRFDMVRRLTYLDRPDVPYMFGVKGMGLRMKISFEF